MIDEGERFMHITTHHISAKRRHIDAATRLRRLSHVVAVSTRVVRGCKLPPPVNEKKHSELFYNCARIGSFRSASAACYMRAPRPAAERGFARAYGSTLEARRLWGFIASVLIQPRHPAVRAHVFPLMPSYAAPLSPCGRSTRHVPILRLSEVFAELPQASKWGKWPLRNFRECQNGRNGLCGTSASVRMEEMAFAELPQASKWGKWPLRNFRKRQNGRNGLCGTSASIKMEEMALAELPQASKWKKWPLRNFRKRCSIYSYTIPNI